jgi:hypothetical protein
VRVVAEALDDRLDVFVDEGVGGDLLDPRRQLLLIRKLAVEQSR